MLRHKTNFIAHLLPMTDKGLRTQIINYVESFYQFRDKGSCTFSVRYVQEEELVEAEEENYNDKF